ncbi:MAG: nuclear transport factor 2 family protein [Candidatus Thiodiazotropha sp.]
MSDLIEKTKAYAEACNRRDVDAIEGLFAEDIVFSDPTASNVKSKADVVKLYRALMKDNGKHFAYIARHIYGAENKTIMQCTIETGKKAMNSVAVFDWENGKIKKLEAYLDMPFAKVVGWAVLTTNPIMVMLKKIGSVFSR